MFAYVCNGYTRVFKFFLVFCKYFMFRIYVASVLFGCCKNKSGVAHVAIHMRSEGGASSPCARSGSMGPAWARECKLMRGRAGPSMGNRVQRRHPSERPDASTAEVSMVGP
jgi:hypothetical protein